MRRHGPFRALLPTLVFALGISSGAAAADGEWYLMSRHGECASPSILKRSVPDIDPIHSPSEFAQQIRARGYDVKEKVLEQANGDAVQVEVPEKELWLVFSRARLCKRFLQK